MKEIRLVLCMLGLIIGFQSQAENNWPSKPIKIIVPIAAGGVTDAIVRKASLALSQKLGQAIVVENLTGANGMIGGEACARANPDGYTFCVLNTGITSINPLLYEKHPFDPMKAFVPVANFYSLTGAVVVSKNSKIKTVRDFQLLAKNNPNDINFGTIGPGSYPEIFLSWLNSFWNAKIIGIPYKGGGPVSLALQAGEVQISAAALGNFLGQIKSGQLDVIAVSSQNRLKILPQVPTYKEVGLDEFKGKLWWGVFAPIGISVSVVNQLNMEINQLLNTPQFIEYLESQAAEPALGNPEEFSKYVKLDKEWTVNLIGSMKK